MPVTASDGRSGVIAHTARAHDLTLERLLVFSRRARKLAMSVSDLVLVGCLADIEYMKPVLPGVVPMPPQHVAVYVGARYDTPSRSVAREPDVDVCLVETRPAVAVRRGARCGPADVAEYCWHVDLGIDNLLGILAITNADPRYSVRISPISSTAIALGAAALFLLSWLGARQRVLAQVLATVLSPLMLSVAYGYLHDVDDIYLTLSTASVAPHAAAIWLLPGLDILALTVEHGWVVDFV